MRAQVRERVEMAPQTHAPRVATEPLRARRRERDTALPGAVERVLGSRGDPLDPAVRAYMEARLGHDFGDVRVHADERAAEAAKALDAEAFTSGRDIVFAAGRYRPDTRGGRRLLAHEFVHVVQQERAVTRVNAPGRAGDVHERAAVAVSLLTELGLAPAKGALSRTLSENAELSSQVPALQRQEHGNPATDPRVEDDNFLLCLILCYLGIPPAIWKRVVELYLHAVWEEYRATYEAARAEREFRSFQDEFRAYTVFKVMKAILTFVVRGRLGVFPVALLSNTARAARIRLERFLLARVASSANLTVVEQIARKITLYVEIAFAAGCAAYCGGLAAARALSAFTTAVVEAVLETFTVIGRVIGGVVSGVFVRPILVARAMLDPTNWDLTALPAGTPRTDVAVLGAYLWARLEPDNPDRFVANVTRPLSAYPIPRALIDAIAASLTRVVNARGGFQAAMTFTPELLLGLTPLSFVQLLHDWRLLEYRDAPERVAELWLRVHESVRTPAGTTP